jgi:hypothetical protein
VNDLAARKRLLVAQADGHRRAIALERQRVLQQFEQARDFVQGNRWWLLGGALAGGLLLAPRRSGLLGWLPLAADLWRSLRR